MRRTWRWLAQDRVPVVLRVLLCVALLQICLVSCDGEDVEEPVEPDAVAVFTDYDVRRNDASASATWSALGQLDLLGDGDWHGLLYGEDDAGLVTTDETGQAELCDPDDIIEATEMCEVDACHIWIFEASDTGFGAYVCPKSTHGTDLCSGGSLDLDGCEMCLTTLSGEVCTVSTSFSVTYLWDAQLTIVTVDKGEVDVTAVLAIEGDVPSRDALDLKESVWPDLQVKRRFDDQATRVAAVGNRPRVYYTAPNAILDRIRQVSPEAPPAREALSIDNLAFFYNELPVVLEKIGSAEPNLQLWISGISQRAILRGASFPFFPPPSLDGGELEVRGERDLLTNEHVHQVVLRAADAGNLLYAPSLEREDLRPGLVDERTIAVVFAEDDRQLRLVVKTLFAQLTEHGFRLEVMPVESSRPVATESGMMTARPDMVTIEPGMTVLFLNRR
ncbi:MAG: hypothetical protein PVF04_02200 [Anaerolineae bacterium]